MHLPSVPKSLKLSHMREYIITLLSFMYRYTLDEFGTARRTAVVRGLIDALTRGGNSILFLYR